MLARLFKIIILSTLLLSIKSVYAFEPFVVKDILIQGNKQVSKHTVLAAASMYLGKKITKQDTVKIIKDTFATGYFKSIKVERDQDKLIIVVEERAIIANIEFEGTKKTDEFDKILRDHGITPGLVYNSVNARIAEQQIKYFFNAAKGRFGIKVSSHIKNLPRNRVELTFVIKEGATPKINEMIFHGNKNFSASQLKKVMLQKHYNAFQRLTNSVYYSKETFDASLEELKVFYRNRGYADIVIRSSEVKLSANKENVNISIYLNEGNQYFVSKVTIDGESFPVAKEQLHLIATKHIKPQDLFSYEKMWRAKEDLETVLGNLGYGRAEARLHPELNPKTKLSEIKFYIVPRKRQMVRHIIFVNNAITKDQVLRREMEQYESAWLSMSKVREGKNAILRRGLVKGVEIRVDEVDDTDDLVDVVYIIDESTTSEISAQVGYTNIGKVTWQLMAKIRNLLGNGVDTNVSFTKNKVLTSYDLDYSDPFFTKNGTGFNVHAYHKKTHISRDEKIFDYVTDSTGLMLGWKWRLTQYWQYDFGFGYQNLRLHIDKDNAPDHAARFLNAYNDKRVFDEYTVMTGLTFNNLDAFFFPTSGMYFHLTAKAAMPPSQVLWYQTELDFSYFQPIANNFIFNFKSNVGLVHTFGTSSNKEFPFYKNYYLGGIDSVRGYLDKGIGPLDSRGEPKGSNMKVMLKGQILCPIPFAPNYDAARIALFVDAGQLYKVGRDPIITPQVNPDSAKISKDLKFTTGIGFTWYTPLGLPIEVVYAIPLNHTPEEAKFVKRFNFRVGMELF